MYNFKYDIKLREDNRPYIYLPDDFSDDPEHRFMVLEVTTYMLSDLIDKYNETGKSENLINELIFVRDFLGEISDESAILIKNSLDGVNEINDMLKQKNNSKNE